MNYEYGPHTSRILFMLTQQVPRLDRQRADTMLLAEGVLSKEERTEADWRARRAARQWGHEGLVMLASETLRRATWSIIWDSTWADAWHVQWLLGRAGVGVATQHLIGLGDYTIEDYVTLVSPWTVGFPDLPLPYTEGIAA